MGGKALRPKSSKQGYVRITFCYIYKNLREITQEAKRDTRINTHNTNPTPDKAIKTLLMTIALHNSQGQNSKEIITAA